MSIRRQRRRQRLGEGEAIGSAGAGARAGSGAIRDGSGERGALAWFLVLLAAALALWLGEALRGDLFLSTELVWNSVQPWSGLGPSVAPHNENLADPPTVWWPMMRFNAELLREWLAGGPPPLWVNESFAGAPWLGNPQSALCSPFTWAFVVLPEVAAFAIVAAAKWTLAALGTWFVARRMGLSPWARALAGIAFAFCGYSVVWIHSPLSSVSVLAPWLLLALERLVERPTPLRTALAALMSWQVVVAGHPETAFWVALAGVAFAAARWFALPEGRGRALLALAGAALLAALLAVVQWWPFLEYALHSYGNELRRLTPNFLRAPDGWLRIAWVPTLLGALGCGIAAQRRAAAGRSAVALVVLAFAFAAGCGAALRLGGLQSSLLLSFLPDLHGRSLDGGRYDGPLTYCDVVGGFTGAALGVTALGAAFLRRGDGRVVALCVAAALGCLRFFRLPGLAELAEAQPTLATIGSSRALCVLALAFALLGGAAFDELRVAPRRLAVACGGALLLLLALAVTPIARAAGEAPLASTSAPGTLVLPENLCDGGASGDGAEISGRAPPGATTVRLTVNGHEVARVPAAADGAYRWQWLGSPRLDEGWYAFVAEALEADGGARPFAQAGVAARHPLQWPARTTLHGAALALVVLLAFARAKSAALVLLLVTFVELAWFGARYHATTPRERIPAAVEPIPWLQAARARVGPYRLFTARTHLHPSLHLPFGLEVTRGYDALEPLDYVRLHDQLYARGLVPWFRFDFGTLDFAGPRGAAIADVLGIRWFLSEEPPPPGYLEVWRRGSLALWENPSALPRAFTVQQGRPLREVTGGGLDPRRVAAWDDAPAADGRPRSRDFSGTARVVALDHGRGRLRAEVESDAGTIVLFSENFGGWEATVDGAPAPIEKSHLALQSVVVERGGRHVVEFRYRPRSVVMGAWISGAGLLGVVALLLAALYRRASPQPPREGPRVAPDDAPDAATRAAPGSGEVPSASRDPRPT